MMLPTTFLGTAEVSRFMLGGNPFKGHSHSTQEMNEEMLRYFTMENIKKTLRRCEELGMTSFSVRNDAQMVAMMREYRNEGGKMRWVAQTAPELSPFPTYVNECKRHGACAIYLHGTITDTLVKENNISELKERLAVIRQTGLPVGLCTHMPEVVGKSDAENWDVDFYMVCVYNLSRVDRVSSAVTGYPQFDEPFFEEDRAAAFAAMRGTKKPCIAFKVLGAGRRAATQADVRKALTETYRSIKANDAVMVGMFPRDADQPYENIKMAEEIMKCS
jgi:hypothetical protein